MKNARLLTLFLFAILSSTMMAETIFSFTVTRATTDVGTYNAVGGTAECTRAMAVDGSNEVTIGSQTFYKFNTSTEWKFTLVGNTLAAGDVITCTCACNENKTGKGLSINGVTLTNNFTQGSPNTLVYTVVAGDAFIGKTVISVKRADSDIKFGSIVITRGESSGTDPGSDPGTDPGTDPTPSSGGYDEIIRSTLSGERAAVQTVTGTIGGTSAVKNMGSSSPYKLNANGAYVSIVLASGYYEPTDTLIIDGSKAMQVYYGPAEGGTLLLTTSAPSNGVIRTPLTNLPANQNSIYVYRVSSTYNGTLTYMAVHRPKAAGPSNDATLSAIVYGSDQTPVDNFSASKESYEVELPATYVGGAPSVQVTTTHGEANAEITQATTIPGTATIVVTAEDGTTTKTYTVTFTRESAEPKVESATWDNIKGTAVIDQVNKTITGQVTNGSSLTLTPQFTGKNINSWSPDNAQNFANGTISYTFTSSTNETTTYQVTITEAEPLSSDATLKSLKYGNNEVPEFSPNKLSYSISLNAGIKTPPRVTGEANDSKARVVVTPEQPTIPDTITVVVTAEDGSTLTYTVYYNAEVPQSDLTTHVPEIYEAKDIAGGYNGTLSVSGGREYEVYYINRDNATGKLLTIATSNADKSGSISDEENSTDKTTITKDGWAKISGSNGTGGDNSAGARDEFQTSIRSVKFNSASHELKIRIQGYDQFSFYGKDNNLDASKNKMFEVYIDGVKQTRTPADYSINRFDISTAEHEIHVTAVGGSDSKLCSFSLRLGQEPRTKWLTGNDSTQVVLQSTAIRSVTYCTKYNNIPGAETRLEWLGAEATGIGLTKTLGAITDTLVLSGNALCPVGTYNYAIVAYYNGTETNRVTGSFRVASDIKATSDINVDVYNKEEMDVIKFKYYAMDASAVRLTWGANGQPNGVSGSGSNGVYSISGTPDVSGTLPKDFPYEITVTGADTIIRGVITVKELIHTDKDVLYLYKSTYKTPVFNYIKSKGWNLIERKALDKPRTAEQYRYYKWILISEDVDANNPEVIQVISRGVSNLPILNTKGFTYATEKSAEGVELRLGWGEPDNGAVDSSSVKNIGCNIRIEQNNHPIFAKMTNIEKGKQVKILNDYDKRGVMPIAVNKQGTLCLATAPTRSIEDYYGEGEMQTAIHEVPADTRGGHKYICLPISHTASLTTQGEKLVDGIVDYLTSTQASGVEVPITQIMQFTVAGIDAEIKHGEHSIVLTISKQEYEAQDSLRAATPEITLADPVYTHVIPASGEESDLRFMTFLKKTYTVTDYINKYSYDFSIKLLTVEGLDEVYEAGQWVNVFDIYGRKVATTNEDIYSMELPHGMYIVVTESGQTMKIIR